MCVYVYSNSPRVAQRYGTIAAHTRRRASVLVVFVVFCVHMYSFAGWIRRTPPPTFSDTAITDRHSDTTTSSSELTGCGYPVGSYWIGKIVRTYASGGSRTLDFLRARRAPYPLGQALLVPFKLLLCSHSPNDVPPEPQRNVSIAAVRGAMRPSNTCSP